MAGNSFGQAFRFTTWGESHGPAIGCVIDGCPPGVQLSEADIQPYLDKRRPGQSRFVTQRQEPDQAGILSGVFEGLTTGTPISIEIQNADQRSKDYSEIAAHIAPATQISRTTPNMATGIIGAAGAPPPVKQPCALPRVLSHGKR